MVQRCCSLEDMELNYNFWKNRSVFLTGHTGFKGGWTALWLTKMGAKVNGYSLEAPTTPNFFTVTKLRERLETSTIADILDFASLESALLSSKPSIVIHMAAQSLVRKSYNNPLETFKVNLIGTVNLLEAARKIDSVEAIVNITTDKCYENNEQLKSYKEDDKLGGYDPYSGSKACAEIASTVYRNSFLNENKIKLATVRAGNVIGGGDWATDRLIPDFFRTIHTKKKLHVRFPNAVRPWQHVLEPLSGYLMLAEKIVKNGNNFAGAWNFGPKETDPRPVSWIINYLSQKTPNLKWEIKNNLELHEAGLLLLDSSKAKSKLGWTSRWSLEIALDKTIEWHKAWIENELMNDLSISQINSYENYKI